MRLLPIYWATPATPADWEWLKGAKPADFTDMVKPVAALDGSVGRVLAIDGEPQGFLCDYTIIMRGESREELSDAMAWCLGLERPNVMEYDNRQRQLSDWLKGPVKYVGEEEYHDDSRPSFR